MNFASEKNGVLYGYVKGISMWPEFIPGDILKAIRVLHADLIPDEIIVLNYRSDNPVVHRLISIKERSNISIELHTAGDRGGADPPAQIFKNEELLKVIGVLRKGKWKTPGRRPYPLASVIPCIIVRVHCKLARKLFW
ncbi:MAG: S24/S26 family peptidase [Candidatus Aegiribacteria sp.]|nr:S24/S26 family peptidase [Candidatus Aegiribacteria sp.]